MSGFHVSVFVFVFDFYMLLALPISFKLEARSWRPEAGSQWANSACECVLFGLQGVFYIFELVDSI